MLALALAAALAWLVGNVRQNLPRMGIEFGFDFLGQPAGFEIGENLIGYQPGQTIFRAYLAGMVNTIHVAALGIVLATMLALVLALARLSPNWLLSKLAWGYIELFRNTPLLLQLLFLHITFAQVLPAPRLAWSPLPGSSSAIAGCCCRRSLPTRSMSGSPAGSPRASPGLGCCNAGPPGGRRRPVSGRARAGRRCCSSSACRSPSSSPAARPSRSNCRPCAASTSAAATR